MKASALSAAIPILGRSAEDRKQMKRADPFGLVLRVGSVQQVDLPEPGQAVKDVAPEPQNGPGSDPFAAGRRHWGKAAKFKETCAWSTRSWLKLTAAQPSASATSPTTSPDRFWRPAGSGPNYTLDHEEPDQHAECGQVGNDDESGQRRGGDP
jgi:hypothetical protein